jgi:hypothetical protein
MDVTSFALIKNNLTNPWKRKHLGIPLHGTKIEANFRNLFQSVSRKKTRSQFRLLEQETFVLNHFPISYCRFNVKNIRKNVCRIRNQLKMWAWKRHLSSEQHKIRAGFGSESIATLPPFGPLEGHEWLFQISSQ